MPEESGRNGRFERARSGVSWVPIACALLAIAFCLRVYYWRDAPISYDVYAAHYPILHYAKESLAQGHGLLWNRLQNCGQPFLPGTLTGFLYPINWVVLLLGLDYGFLVVAMLHLTLTGLGMYALCRELSLSRVAAAGAALGWELSAQVLVLAGWQPTSMLGVYVWIPFAMLFAERILRQPTALNGIGLGVVLTLQTLPGYPQILFFTAQLLGLRVLWQILSRPRSISFRLLGVVALGLALPLFLGAAALLPMAEFAQVSLRNAPLSPEEMEPKGPFTWEAFRNEQLAPRGMAWGTTLGLVPLALGGLGIAAARNRRLPLFYLLTSALFMLLAFETPLSAAYRALPMGDVFREPTRFLWMFSFTLSVLASFGLEALRRTAEADTRRLPLVLSGLVLGAAVLFFTSPVGLLVREWVVLAGLAGACWLAYGRGRPALAAWSASLLLLANLWIDNAPQTFSFLREGSLLARHQAAFEFVRGRITPQQRIHQYGIHPDYAMMPKSASIFGIPSIGDYEPQASRRYAEFYVRMMDAQPMDSINRYYFRFNHVPKTPRLFDLVATRYVLVADPSDFEAPLYTFDFSLIWARKGIRIFENPNALPRAFYVPRARVVDAGKALDRMSLPAWEPRRMLLLEQLPADGFLGSDRGTGAVEILSDRSEQLELEIHASADGFLFVSDQDYPGWEALLDGEAVPILRANHAFRAVRVPAGASSVVFRYRPASVRTGFAVSLVTGLGVLAFIGMHLRRRSGTGRRPAPADAGVQTS